MLKLVTLTGAAALAVLTVPAFAQDNAVAPLGDSAHAEWCAGTYQNYDAASDMFMDPQGNAYVCVSPGQSTVTLASVGGALFAPIPAPDGHTYSVFPEENDVGYGLGDEENPDSGL
jgi:hypothetical protein